MNSNNGHRVSTNAFGCMILFDNLLINYYDCPDARELPDLGNKLSIEDLALAKHEDYYKEVLNNNPKYLPVAKYVEAYERVKTLAE